MQDVRENDVKRISEAVCESRNIDEHREKSGFR